MVVCFICLAFVIVDDVVILTVNKNISLKHHNIFSFLVGLERWVLVDRSVGKTDWWM